MKRIDRIVCPKYGSAVKQLTKLYIKSGAAVPVERGQHKSGPQSSAGRDGHDNWQT